MTAAMLVVFKWMSQSEIYLAHVRVYLSTMAIAFALPIVLWKMYRDGDREYAAKQAENNEAGDNNETGKQSRNVKVIPKPESNNNIGRQ